MIEAPELVTPTQRKLHDRWIESHRRFFPSPPVISKAAKAIEMTVEVKAEPPPCVKRERDWLLVASPCEPITIARINGMVAARWNVNTNDILSARRTHDIVIPRQIVCLLARILTLKSYPTIAGFLGGRDHTTVLASVRKFNWLGDQLRKELNASEPLETWVNRAFELSRDPKQK